MNPTQQRFLLNRLDTAKQEKPGRYAPVKLATPDAVKAARRAVERANAVLTRWSDRAEAARELRNKKIRSSYNEARSVILFGDAAKALKAVEMFERAEF